MAECGRIEWISGEDPYSSVKVVKAIASEGYTFLRWQGDFDADPMSNPLTVHFTGDSTYKNVIALFRQNTTYLLTIRQASEHGTAAVRDFAQYPSHKEVQATAEDGYLFSHWVGDYITDENKTDNPVQIYMDQSKPTASLYPVFIDDERYTVLALRDGTVEKHLVDGQMTYQSLGYDSLITGDRAKVKSIHLGTLVTSIGDSCCKNFTSLTSIVFTQDLESIGEEAFYNCTSLLSFDFSKAKSLGKYAFYGSKIQSIENFSADVQTLPEGCFYKCAHLQSAVIPSSIQSIGEYCFASCQSLTSIDLRAYIDNIPSIHSSTFDPISSIEGRTFYFNSQQQTQLAYSNPIWTTLYSEIDPQLQMDTIMKYNASKNSILRFSAYINDGQAGFTVNFGDGTSQTFTKSGEVNHKYAKAYSPAIVTIDNGLSSISVNDKNIVAIDAIGSSISYLGANALKGTKILSLELPRTVLSIDNPLMQQKSSFPIVTAQGGVNIGSNWLVLRNGSLVNLFCADIDTSFSATSINQLTHLTRHCFASSSSLQAISLPNSLQQASLPLVDTTGLPMLTALTIQNGGEFTVQNGMLLDGSKKICLTTSTPGDVPNDASSIGSRAFTNTALQQIVVPSNIQCIDSNAICNNHNLNRIDITWREKDDVEADLDEMHWIYGGPEYVVINDDDKKQAKPLTIACLDGDSTYIAVTDEQGYVKKDLQPSKVICLTVSNDYVGTRLNPLLGMTNDSDRIETMLNGFAQVIKLKNSAATVSAVKSKIVEIISSLERDFGDDGLFIFHDSGHGGNDESRDAQYMCLYDGNLYDYEFWELLKNARCRAMAIFCTCHSGTMFSAPALNELGTRQRLKADEDADEDEGIYKQKGWATSAQEFFGGMDPYDPEQNQTVAARSLLKANAPDDFEPRLCVYGACSDSEVSYMASYVGHGFMTSIVENFNRNNKLDSYQSLFDNSTTDNEKSRSIIYDNPTRYQPAPDKIHPQYYVSEGFDDSIRVFT